MKYKYVYFFIIILFSFELKASKYIDKGYYVIDLENKVEWLKCTVGQYWSDEESKCMGIAKKLNMSEIDEAKKQINSQLDGTWRLPSRKELESLVCKSCEEVKIDLILFPNTPAEPFWTYQRNWWSPKFFWSVNFFTGHTFGRFVPEKKLFVRFLRER